VAEYFNMEIIGKNIGSGIRSDYSSKEAKLEFYFQIPTFEQLLELKITKFNKDPASRATKNIKGKKVTEETYKVFLKNILKQFSQRDDFYSNIDDIPYEILDISPYLEDIDTFLEKHKCAKEVLYNAVIKIDPKHKISFESFNEDSLLDLIGDLCPFYFILIVNGWSTDLVEKNKNIFIRWTFSFDGLTNELVEDVFKTDIDNESIYYYIEPGTYYNENLIHLMYSPFDLDDYLLYYEYSLTSIFEHQLDLKKIVRTEPLEQIPPRYKDL
tara:strand:- start:263 stop:1072 length:810 start_codon:yes stop_codon:yes gene_type:complete